MSEMDDVYAMELLRQSLIDANEREERLKVELETARYEVQESQRREFVFKVKYRELDDALEVEEAKTNAERLARTEAEERARQHQNNTLKARRNEKIANEHCDAAESEIVRLQSDLSKECSATVAAGLRHARLQEDLALATADEMTAYGLIDAAKAKICALQEDLGTATDRVSLLESEARELEETFQEAHQGLVETEKTLSAVIDELEISELKGSDLVEEYEALEATCIKRDSAMPIATAFDTERDTIEEQSPNRNEWGRISNLDQKGRQGVEINRDAVEKSIVKRSLSAGKDREIIPIGMPSLGLPALPEPTILRPATVPVTACQIEILRASGRSIPALRTNANQLHWRFLWKLPSKSLRALFQGVGRH